MRQSGVFCAWLLGLLIVFMAIILMKLVSVGRFGLATKYFANTDDDTGAVTETRKSCTGRSSGVTVAFNGTATSNCDDVEDYISLVIVVLSARDRFAQRMAQRESWINSAYNNTNDSVKINVKFVIGDQSCDIHPADRIDSFSCHFWDIGLPNLEEASITGYRNSFNHGYQGYAEASPLYFDVLQTLELSTLLINGSCQNLKEAAIISIYDRVTENILVSLNVTEFVTRGGIVVFSFATPLLLFKGFQGVIHSKGLFCAVYNRDAVNCSKLIKCVSPSIYSAYVLQVTCKEKERLIEHIKGRQQRSEAWLMMQSKVDRLFQEEVVKYDDILNVKGLVDVYRNLPKKLLESMTWFVENTTAMFFMKTDDDCMVDVPSIVKKLSNFLQRDKLWLGSFRRNWAVETHGKWAELDYNSLTYPPFACGSGYILSRDLVKWLVRNREHLHYYQGEDVSLAIWLAPLLPYYVDDQSFCCDLNCADDDVTKPELSSEEMRKIYQDSLSTT